MSLTVACAPQQVEVVADDPGLFELLTAGRHQTVLSYPISAAELARLRDKDRRMGFVLTRVLINQGLSAAALFVADDELAHGVAPWSGYAAGEVAVDLIARERWSDAAALARGALLTNPNSGDLLYALGHALYQQQLFADLALFIAQPQPAGLFFVRVAASEYETERLVWAAMAAFQNRDTAVVARFVHPFVARAAGPLHRRLYLYMVHNRAALPDLAAEERRVVDAVYRTAVEEWAEAARLFVLLRPEQTRAIVDRHDGSIVAVSRSARQAFERAGQQSVGARWLEALAADLEPNLRRAVLAEAAMAHMAAREFARARTIMVQLLRGTAPDSIDRIERLQLWLRAAEDLSLAEMVEGLIAFDASPATVAHTIERHLSALVAERSFGDIARLYATLPTTHSEARLHLTVVLIAAGRAGLIEAATLSDHAIDPYLLAELARNAPAGSYYRLVAEALLELPAVLWHESAAAMPAAEIAAEPSAAPAAASADSDAATPADPQGAAHWDRAEALLAAGLPREAFTIVWRLALDPFWAERALSYARRMSAWGDTPGALDLSRRAVARRAHGPGPEDIPYLYPLAYQHEISAVTTQAQIDEALFFAIVREESHFSATARSWVGAIGLSQLMSATAADMATRLRLSNPDLNDPWTNLHIGAQYMAYLQRLMPHQLLAIASYNAGPGRGRTWNDRFGELPAILLVEAVPFHETRNYLRKVIHSWVYYRLELSGTAPQETLSAIFFAARNE